MEETNQAYLQDLLSLLTANQHAKPNQLQQATQVGQQAATPQNNLQNLLQAAYYPQLGQNGAVNPQNPAGMQFPASLPGASQTQQMPQQAQSQQMANGYQENFGMDNMGAGNSPLALTHLGVNKGVGDSKEKNRQAQRRFRERQKQMISHLQDQVKMLSQKVESLQKQNEELFKENKALKAGGMRVNKSQNGSKPAKKVINEGDSPALQADIKSQEQEGMGNTLLGLDMSSVLNGTKTDL